MKKNHRLALAQIIVTLIIFLTMIIGIGCEKKQTDIIDPVIEAPYLSNATLRPDVIDGDLILVDSVWHTTDVIPLSIETSIKVNVSTNIPLPANVECSILNSRSSSLVTQSYLHDDGVAPDLVKGDSIYSGKIDFTLARSEAGKFQVVFLTQGLGGSSSNSISLPLLIQSKILSPVLVSIHAPDTLKLQPTKQTILLQAVASDLYGLFNIKYVFFNSFIPPDMHPSSANPIDLYDDGAIEAHGDSVANDGKYSRLVEFPSNVPLGTYRWEFQVQSQSDAMSNKIIHYLTVKP
jgi:hypothetical protein